MFNLVQRVLYGTILNISIAKSIYSSRGIVNMNRISLNLFSRFVEKYMALLTQIFVCTVAKHTVEALRQAFFRGVLRQDWKKVQLAIVFVLKIINWLI